ncbi:MAG TPA: A24 family peptidase [Acidimicrobiia bacterium]|jgi:leader peptidase (prepilin peptidase)/N-methyltransferase
MTALLVVGCSILGLVVGWLLDPVITRVPLLVPEFVPPDGAEPPASMTRRVVVTVLTGALFGATAARFDDSWLLPAYLVLAGGLVALAVIDLETYLLPNKIVYPLTGAMLVLLAAGTALDGNFDDFLRGLLAGAIWFAFLFAINWFMPRAMGFGDVRLSFSLGLSLGVLGWGEVVLGFFLGFLYGAVIGMALVVARRRKSKQQIPFGPFMVAGALTAILVGTPIVDWYLGR